MKFQEAINQIEAGKIDPVYLVLGTEAFFHHRLKEVFSEQVVGEDKDLNQATYNMEEVTLGLAIEEAQSVPFFGDQRLIFIENPYFLTGGKGKAKLVHDEKWLEEYLKNPVTSTVLVFIVREEKLDNRRSLSKLLKKQATTIDVAPLSDREIKTYMQDVIKNEGYQMDRDAMDLFLLRVNNQLTQAMQEWAKMKLFLDDRHQVTKLDVEVVVSITIEENIFLLAELLMKGKIVDAISLYRELRILNEEPIKINAILLSQFRLFLQVKLLLAQGYQEADMGKVIKGHPYRIKLAVQSVRNYSLADLQAAFVALVESDYKMKTGQADKELEFEWFALAFK